MSLLDKIKCINLDAARKLEENNFINDRDIKSLRPEDLHKQFPGQKYQKLRLAIMDVIRPKQVETRLKKMKDSIQPSALRAALSNNNVLDDYLDILRGMKNQMDHVQSFLNTQIDFLEEIRESVPGENSCKEAEGSDMQTGEEDTTSGPSRPNPPGERPQPQMKTAQGASPPSQNLPPESDLWDTVPELTAGNDSSLNPETSDSWGQPISQPQKGHQKKHITYQIVLGGKTFDAHKQLMDKLKKKHHIPLVEFDESKQNHQIIMLFCPISTRISLDVKAAMDEVKDNKPIILVLMHHYPEPRCVANRKTWEDYPNIELFVNVFYHDSVSGLIKCEENGKAIHLIKGKLAEIYTKNNPEASKTAQWLRPEGDQAVCDEQTSGKYGFLSNLLPGRKK